MSYEHDYYSDQCAGCKWAEWRGGCLNKATADDGSDLDAADRDECKHFEAGQPQRRPPQPGDRVYVHIPLAEYDALQALAEDAKQRAEAAEAALKQAQDDGRLMLASMGIDMWRRLDAAGRTRLEQELDSGLRNSTEDDGERIPYAELYAYRRLLALGDFFDNPRGESPPVAALPEPGWYTTREVDDEAGVPTRWEVSR